MPTGEATSCDPCSSSGCPQASDPLVAYAPGDAPAGNAHSCCLCGRASNHISAFLKLLTINAKRMAISTIDSMAAFCHDRLADVIALQEINVNPASATGFVSNWRAKGYLCILGGLDPSCALHRVALLARCPIQHVQLQVTVCQSRCAAGFVEIFGPNSKSCILLASFYGQSGDLVATDMLFRDFLQAAQRFGGPFVVMGDFNCTLAEAPVAPHLASGNLRCLDDDLPSCLPCTNPVDTRRIDFALAHPR